MNRRFSCPCSATCANWRRAVSARPNTSCQLQQSASWLKPPSFELMVDKVSSRTVARTSECRPFARQVMTATRANWTSGGAASVMAVRSGKVCSPGFGQGSVFQRHSDCSAVPDRATLLPAGGALVRRMAGAGSVRVELLRERALLQSSSHGSRDWPQEAMSATARDHGDRCRSSR